MRHFSCMIATVSSLNHHNQESWVKDVSWVCLNVKEVFCHPAAQYHRRRRTALWVTISLLTLGLLVLTVGLISATRTDNVPVVGLYPGIIVSGGHLYSVNVLSVMKQTFLLLSDPSRVHSQFLLSVPCSWVSEHFWVLLASTWWKTADLWWVCSSCQIQMQMMISVILVLQHLFVSM